MKLSELKKAVDAAVKEHGGGLPVRVSIADDESFGNVVCEIGDVVCGLDDDTGDNYSPAFFVCGNY